MRKAALAEVVAVRVAERNSHEAGRGLEDLLREIVRDEVRAALADLDLTGEPKPALLTSDELAGELRVSTAQIRALTRDEGMPCIRVGDCRRYVLADVLAWLAVRRPDEE
jgi:hypothetical protein